MSDIATPTILDCRFSYGQWRASLAKKKEQDPSGIPVKVIERLIGPVLIPLPYVFNKEGYAANLIVCGEPPLFIGFDEQPGWAIWQVSPETILIQNFLNRRCRARIEVIIVEGPLRCLLSRVIHLSKAEQQAWANQPTPEGSDPHGHS